MPSESTAWADEVAIPSDVVFPTAFTAQAVLQEAIDSTKDSPETWDRMSEDACILRLRALAIPMKRYVQKVRECEGFLSKAQLEEDHGLVPGTHNYTTHMIAEQNYKHDISSMRISRYANWAFQMEKVKTLVRQKNEAIPNFDLPKTLKPSCLCDSDGERVYQVVASRMQGSVRIGVVEEIFRGVITKPPKGKSNVTRRMRVTKPVTFELSTQQCSRVKVSTLQPWDDDANCWITSVLHPGHILDPLDEEEGVLCEFHVVRVVQKFPRLILRLGDDTGLRLSAMKQVSESRGLSTP